MNDDQLHELLYQAFETELGGIEVYETALRCVQNNELHEEFEKYLGQTRHHVELVENALRAFGLDPSAESPGRSVVRHIGESLVAAMEMALQSAPPGAAQLVATECVVLAETKDHLNWDLLGQCLTRVHGEGGAALRAAHEEVMEQESEHLYHSSGWGRELWVESLGMPAVLPPPEEQRDVKTAIGAARAEQARSAMT